MGWAGPGRQVVNVPAIAVATALPSLQSLPSAPLLPSATTATASLAAWPALTCWAECRRPTGCRRPPPAAPARKTGARCCEGRPGGTAWARAWRVHPWTVVGSAAGPPGLLGGEQRSTAEQGGAGGPEGWRASRRSAEAAASGNPLRPLLPHADSSQPPTLRAPAQYP